MSMELCVPGSYVTWNGYSDSGIEAGVMDKSQAIMRLAHGM